MRNAFPLPRLPLPPSAIALLGLALPLAASAHNWSYGFAWAMEMDGRYEADPWYSYNDAGTPPRVERTETGKYSVRFHGIDGISPLEANVQVTAYGADASHCKPLSWGGDSVTVLCFDAAGSLHDSFFSVLFLEADLADHAAATPSDVGNYAFALADQPASASYNPDPSYASNPGGGPITATRSGPGSYSITFTGFSAIGFAGGHVQVTAVGTGAARCRIQSWGSETASVRCFDAAGAPADSAYSILFWRPDVADPGLAFAWASQAATASYTPPANYVFNAGGGTIAASRTATGRYQMQWDGMDGIGVNGGNVQVTAYGGTTDVRCKVDSWTPTNAFVRCYDAAGNPADSQYTVLFLKTPKKPWAREFAFAYAPYPSDPSYHPYYGQSHNPAAGHDFDSAHFDPRTDIEITRSSTGVYRVDFEGFRGFAGGGNVQVVAALAPSNYCKVWSWGDEHVWVSCFDGTGSPSDTAFWVFYLKAPPENTSVAYAWADQADLLSYTPDPVYSHNPAGGAITATRSSVGSYTMTWSGFGALESGGGHPQVTAYGSENSRCQIQSWGLDSVSVRCFDSAGNLADSRYSILYLRPAPEDDGLAFAWADDFTAPSSYTPSPTYSFNAGHPVVGWNFGVGNMSLAFEQFDWRGLNVGTYLVNGYGLSDKRCQFSTSGPIAIVADCVDAASNPVDAQWNGLRIKPVAVPEPAHAAMLASGAALLALLSRRAGRTYLRAQRHHANGTKNA